jgi:hypothetical protein
MLHETVLMSVVRGSRADSCLQHARRASQNRRGEYIHGAKAYREATPRSHRAVKLTGRWSMPWRWRDLKCCQDLSRRNADPIRTGSSQTEWRCLSVRCRSHSEWTGNGASKTSSARSPVANKCSPEDVRAGSQAIAAGKSNERSASVEALPFRR